MNIHINPNGEKPAPEEGTVKEEPIIHDGSGGAFEGTVLVTALRSPSLARLGLRVGDEIVAIDSEPVHDYAERRVAPYVGSSTPQDRDVRMYGYELLMGDADVPLLLSVRDARGRVREVAVPRKGYDGVIAPKQFELRKLPGGIVILR